MEANPLGIKIFLIEGEKNIGKKNIIQIKKIQEVSIQEDGNSRTKYMEIENKKIKKK